jgi:hypothetical protein
MALIHDAVQLFARALRRLDPAAVDIRPLDCESQISWGHGASLINFMKDVSEMVLNEEPQSVYFGTCMIHKAMKRSAWSLRLLSISLFVFFVTTLPYFVNGAARS